MAERLWRKEGRSFLRWPAHAGDGTPLFVGLMCRSLARGVIDAKVQIITSFWLRASEVGSWDDHGLPDTQPCQHGVHSEGPSYSVYTADQRHSRKRSPTSWPHRSAGSRRHSRRDDPHLCLLAGSDFDFNTRPDAMQAGTNQHG